jgi:hypothetical protein
MTFSNLTHKALYPAYFAMDARFRGPDEENGEKRDNRPAQTCIAANVDLSRRLSLHARSQEDKKLCCNGQSRE